MLSGESKAEGGGKLSSRNPNYFYRVNYPNLYMCEQGLKVIKFERTGNVNNEWFNLSRFNIRI
jgi:hypothetical protein